MKVFRVVRRAFEVIDAVRIKERVGELGVAGLGYGLTFNNSFSLASCLASSFAIHKRNGARGDAVSRLLCGRGGCGG